MNVDQIFCTNQIVIPPTLPSILKKYSKAAIRTQPYDLLVWSAAYFKAMATGGTPPVKTRLEFPLPEERKLTLGYVKLLVYQFGKDVVISRDELTEKWNDVCLPHYTLYNILRLGSFAHTIEWSKFVAIALGFLEESLKGTMIRVCEVLTEEPEGGSAMIPSQLFITLYRYLGAMDCGIPKVEEVKLQSVKDEKQPCLQEGLDQYDSSEKDIDSVIKEIGEAESSASIETHLEGTGAELNWPNIESKTGSEETEVRFPSIPSDEGATSLYGIEVMDPLTDAVLPTQETVEDEDEIDTQEPGLIVSEEDIQDVRTLEGTQADDESVVSVGAERVSEVERFEAVEDEEDLENVESSSEAGSMKVILAEKDETAEEKPLSTTDSQISEAKKPIDNLDREGIEKTTSLIDLRPTMDRETRKKIIGEGLESEEQRRLRVDQEAAAEAEKKRIEDEAKNKYHMEVVGIGSPLPADLMDKVEEYILCCAERQSNMVMPRNLRHFLCPPLDLQGTDKLEGLEELLEESGQGHRLTSASQAKDQSSIIELLKSDEKGDSLSSVDTSVSNTEDLAEQHVIYLSSLSYQPLSGGVTSLTHLLPGDK